MSSQQIEEAPEYKSCPSCAESIKSAAAVCRYCGFDFRASVVQSKQQATRQGLGTNGFAIASLVLGIVWIYFLGSILALIFGYVARRQIDESDGLQSGRGMATAGIVLGWIGVGILVAAVAAAVIVPVFAARGG
jgi:hypothetical protein